MIKNFSIRDGVIFGFPEEVDLRGDCELSSFTRYVGIQSSVEMDWMMIGSNRGLRITFSGVEDFEVRGRDFAYPNESGVTLGIAGFCRRSPSIHDNEFFIEPSDEMNYFAFVMDDQSAFLVKAASAHMRRR